MEITTIQIGRLSVTLLALDDQQVANVFGVAARSNLTAPAIPEGTNQEEAYVGSDEFRAAYDAYVRDFNRIESVGFLAAARDPILIMLGLGTDDPVALKVESERAEIQSTAAKMGFVHDERYPEDILEGEMIAFIAEKSAKFFPAGFATINKFVSECLRRVGVVGGAAIDAEIKSETTDLSGPRPDESSDECPQQAEDSVREAQPTA